MSVPSALRSGILALALWATVAAPPAARAAQVACDHLVSDDAGVFGPGLAAVTEAAEALVAAGADVRVHTLTRFDTPDLDTYEATIRQQCPSWLGEGGSRKPDLVVVIVAIENQRTGVYFGTQWERALSGRWTAVQTQVMNPRFRTGDFAGGMAAGLQELARIISAEAASTPTSAPDPPDAPGPTPTAVAPPGPAPPPSPVDPSPAPPPDYQWLSRVVAGVVALVGTWLLVRAVVRARRRRRRRLEAQRRAVAQSEQLGRAFSSLSDRWSRVEPAAQVMIESLHREAAEPLRSQRDATASLVQRATAAFRAHQDGVASPSRRLSVEQYVAVETACTALLPELAAAELSVSVLDEERSRLSRLLDELPARLEPLGHRLADAMTAADAAAGSGFKVRAARTMISQAEAARAEAAAALAARHPDRADRSARTASELADSVAGWVERLPFRQAELEAEIRELDDKIARTQASLAEGRHIFGDIASRYAESCWESIRGNGTESEKRLTRSLGVVDDCRRRITMKRQEWDAAAADLARVRQWLQEVDSLLHSIAELAPNLEQAERDAPGALEMARADIEKAAAVIAERAAHVTDDFDVRVREASEEIEAAASGLGQDKPDPVAGLRLIRSAHDKVDGILTEARSDHEQDERLRIRAGGRLRDARAAVSRAGEYIADHQGDVGSATENTLARAEQLLGRAEAATDPTQRIEDARAAEDLADEAYTGAGHEFAEAERERRDSAGFLSMSSAGGWGHSDSSVGPTGW